VVLIDGVVHALHRSTKGPVSNFAVRNFIEASRPKIVALSRSCLGSGSGIAERARLRWEKARGQYREGAR